MEQYSKVFNIETMVDAYEDVLQIQGPDSIPVSSEGAVFERVEIENVRSKRITPLIYKAEVKITREMLDDTKYKQCTDAVGKLATAATRTIERIGANFFANGFSSVTSPDGDSVFNTAHDLSNALAGNSNTCSNRGTGTLSDDNISAARTLGRKTLDEHGSIAPAMLSQLIIPPDLEDQAEMLMTSKLRPESADNGENVRGRRIKEIQVLDFLSEADNYATTMWFLRDPEVARNVFMWRKRPERSVARDPGSDDFLYRIYFRCVADCEDWRGLFGSTGTGTATALV